ncbi:MAG: methyltransferase domain-containing protein [Kiritimatiellae bacterium]|nr:methyltransferase domain-containing protein [Kiritimatiellia bacterium]
MPQWDAQDYHGSSGAQQKWARELLPKLRLAGHERLLDIGCGDGKVTAELAAHLPDGSVLGIDNSAEMIGFAQAHFPPARFPNLRFQIADAARLDFDAEFDVVFSNACLHWVRDHRPVLAGIARSLRPAGRVLLQMGGRGNAADILTLVEPMIAGAEWGGWFRGFQFPYGFHGPDEYRGWLEAAGFRRHRVELIPKDMTQAGRDALCGWIRTTWLPYTQRVPEARRRAFVEELADRYLAEHPPAGDGLVHVGMVRLEVEAERD